MRKFDIYSFHKDTPEDDRVLEKRTETPLGLLEAQKIASKYSKMGHIIEFRRVSQED